MSTELHRVRITVPQGRAALTRITLDGAELRGASVVNFHVGLDGMSYVTLQLFADVELVGELPIIKTWRRARPRRSFWAWLTGGA